MSERKRSVFSLLVKDVCCHILGFLTPPELAAVGQASSQLWLQLVLL
jgi:hypothetical protein